MAPDVGMAALVVEQVHETARPAIDHEFEVELQEFFGIPADDAVLDMSVQIAPHLSRVCRTCRDYRPGDSSERGWCTNRWAFTHRRMVDAAEEMPCQTSLGTWWLPVDDDCLGIADVMRHGEPTPLLDGWLSQYLPDVEPEADVRRRRRM